MHADLAPTQWDAITSGQLIDPSGARWSRRSTRIRRSVCEQLIVDGAPLVLYYYAGGQLDWLDGDDAVARWRRLRAGVTSVARRRGDLEWTAGIWDCEARKLVLLTGHC
jgi:hypothetical protein